MPSEETVKELLGQYHLCDLCLGRQFPTEAKSIDYASRGRELKKKIGATTRPAETCYICGGLTSSIDKYVNLVLNALKDYEFDSLVIGARIPIAIVEKEDHLRAETKLRGGETFKTSFTGELNHAVAERLGVEVKHRRPDVTAVVDVLIDHVEVNPRPVYVYGRYLKTKRGIPQKRRRCQDCRGEGCPECGLTGYVTSDSVEQRLAEPLVSLFRGGRVKFTWIGSEDAYSLVSGSGRPFYAEVLEPMIRRPRNMEKVLEAVDDGVSLKELTILRGRPREDRSFTVTVRSHLTLDRRPIKKMLPKLEEALTGATVTMNPPNKKNRITKTIHRLTVESAKGRSLQLRIECDGGLSIRRFLTGEDREVTPNVADILGRKITLDEAKPFDILNVDFEA